MLVAAGLFAAPPRVGASHADAAYDLPVWFRWDKSVLDVVIVPPNHGQLVNDNGVLDGGDPGELTPFNSYLAAVEASVADWDRAIAEFGPGWLKAGVVTNVYVAGRDLIPPSAMTSPEVVIVTDETKGNTLGLAFNTRPCVVDNSKFFTQSFTYEDMFNINSQEYGHCLGLEHVVDNHPEHDAMAGLYVHWPGSAGTDLHCVSNLDVLGLEAVFGRVFGRPSPGEVSIPVDAYATTACDAGATPAPPPTSQPSPGPSPTGTPAPSPSPTGTPAPSPSPTATPDPSPSPTASPTPTPSPPPPTVTPSPTPEPTSSPTPSPEPTPEPPEHARSVTLRLRRHIVARGRIDAPGAPEDCRAGVPVTVEKRRDGAWHALATTETTEAGSFRVRLDDSPGRYRAVAPEVESGAGTCAEAWSAPRKHRD